MALYSADCEKAGSQFSPVGMDLFGGYGSRGAEFLRTLFSRYARHSARATELLVPGQLQRKCWERLSVALHKALARQLVRFAARSGDTPLGEEVSVAVGDVAAVVLATNKDPR